MLNLHGKEVKWENAPLQTGLLLFTAAPFVPSPDQSSLSPPYQQLGRMQAGIFLEVCVCLLFFLFITGFLSH